MARIRTIKPQFFTSNDIVDLPPLGRLLYIAVWCECDREGRLEWDPRALKRRYFPDDSIDIVTLCALLIDKGLVVLYGEGLAHVPTFLEHQMINGRESVSILPAPDGFVSKARGDDTETTRETKPATRHDTARGEGKGKEGKGKERKGKDADCQSPPTGEAGAQIATREGPPPKEPEAPPAKEDAGQHPSKISINGKGNLVAEIPVDESDRELTDRRKREQINAMLAEVKP